MVSPELLRRYPFFAGFTGEELKGLAMAGHEREVSTGRRLFVEGGPAEHLYFLVDGEIEIVMRVEEGDSRGAPLSTLPAGELVGWSALVEPRVYTASARATRPCRVIEFSGMELARLAEDAHFCGLLMQKIAQVISRRLRDAHVQLLGLSATPA